MAETQGYKYKSLFRIVLTNDAEKLVVETKYSGESGAYKLLNVRDGSAVPPIKTKGVTVITARKKFGAVTGIKMGADDRSAVTEFDYMIEPTVFGHFFGVEPRSRRGSAIFEKYDDGWRLLSYR